MQLTPTLWFTAITVAFGYSILYGYNTAKLNTPIHIIQKFYNESYRSREIYLSVRALNLLWAITISSYVAMGAFGSFTVGYFANKFGRRKALMIDAIISLVAGILEGIAKPLAIPELLILGRFVTGFSVGLGQGLATMYLLELSPKKTRGAVGGMHQFGVTFGILLAQIFGMSMVFGTETLWPLICAFTSFPGIIAAFVLIYCPESPRYLFLVRSDEKACREALVRLHPTAESLESELKEMKLERETAELMASEPQLDAAKRFKFRHLIRRREQRVALLINVSLMICQMCSGINAIFAYSHSVLISAGISEDHVQYAIVGTGVINIAVTMLAIPLIEKIGRRNLIIYPTLLMCVSMGALIATINLQEAYRWLSYLSVCLLLLYIVGFGLGLGPIAILISSETFDQDARPTGVSIANSVHWTFNFIVQLTFKFIEASCGEFLFLIYICVVISSLSYVALRLPETANRDIHRIVDDLRKGWRWRPCTKENDSDKETDTGSHEKHQLVDAATESSRV